MKKQTSPGWGILGLLCTLFFCLSVFPVVGQTVRSEECPPLEDQDINMEFVLPSSNCESPGLIYLNLKPLNKGIDRIHYRVFTPSWQKEVDLADPMGKVLFAVPKAEYAKEMRLRVTYTCGSNTRTKEMILFNDPDDPYNKLELPPIEYVSASISSVSPGNGLDATGSISSRLEYVSGIQEATFRLYKKSDPETILASVHSTTPYAGVTFDNLQAGEYFVKVEAKPICQPNPLPENWENGHLVLYSDTEVLKPFKLIVTPLESVGSCPGGLKVEVSGVKRVQTIEYALFENYTLDTPIQTFIATYPNFTHIFRGLKDRWYYVKATEKTGNAVVVETRSVSGAVPRVEIETVHDTYLGKAEGAVRIMMNGITEDCPVKYTITRKKGEGNFTPIVKEHVTETATLIEGLPAGLYSFEARFGDEISERSFRIDERSIGKLRYMIEEQPKLCEPTAKISWEIEEGLHYHPRKVRLTNRETGSLVREFTLPVEVRTFETNNLFGGAYKLTLIDETAGVETSSEFTIGTKRDLGIEGDISVEYGNATVDFCRDKAMVRIPFKYWGDRGIEQAPHLSHYLERAIYEIYRPDGKTLVYSGMVPKLTGNEVSYIETPEIGKDYKLYIKSPCGYPVDTFGLYSSNYQLNTNLSFRGCGRKGRDVVMSVVDPQSHPVPNITFKVKNRTTGAVVAEHALGAGEENFTIEAMAPGDYVVEWFPQCAPTQLHTELLNVSNSPQVREIDSYSALCKYNDGYISVSYYDLEIAGGWRHELYRKSDHKLLKAYDGNYVSATFKNLQAGEYIVKTAPVVECDEMLPIETEVTVGSREPEKSTINFVTTETATAPYKKEGVAHYQSVFDHLSWEVYDFSTGELLNKGTTESNKEYAPYEIKIDKLPQSYKIVFDTPCGKVERIDHLETTESPVGFDLITTDAHETSTCSDFGILTVKSRLKAAGLPEKGTKIMLYNYYDVPIDSVKNATSIIESHSFVLKNPGDEPRSYRVAYFYDGTMVEKQAWIEKSYHFSPEVRVSPFSLKGAATLSVRVTSAEPGTKMRVEVKGKAGNDEIVLADEVVPADDFYRLKVARANSPFSTRVTMMGGCYDGKSESLTVNGSPATFSFKLNTNTMRCRNDGVITPVVPEVFHDVDQIHFTLTKVEDSGSSSYTTVSETTTPAVPKPFIGLEAGTYRVAGRATVFHDEHNQPVVQDFETTTTLYFSGGEGLYAQARPDYGLPSFKQCPGGSIGLEIEKGTGQYRVFLKSTPEGPLETPQEIFPTSKDDNRRWGRNLAVGHYSLSVTDGCMERDIPDAEILEIANEANVSTSSTMRPFGRPDRPLDSLAYTLHFDPYGFPALARPSAYKKYEVQLVHKGEQPDEQKWMSNWFDVDRDGNAKISGKINKSENCEYEVLFRPKECPALLKRLPFKGNLISPFEGKWVKRGCDSVQWVFTSGEVGRHYAIGMLGSNSLYPYYINQDVVFQTPSEYLRPNPEFVFPAREPIFVIVNTSDGCPMFYQSNSSPVVDRQLHDQLDDGRTFSDCDGRRLSIRGWRNSCQQPMKYYAYEVNENGEETLVAQSDGYLKLEETWNSDYKFKKDSYYVIRILEKGKSEQEVLTRFPLNYKLPSAYELDNFFSRWSFQKTTRNYDFYKKAYTLGEMSIRCSWEDGVPDNSYLTIPKPLKFVATQKQAPHRKFVTTDITRKREYLYCRNWKEELPDGTLSEEAYAPEGEYSFELETVCGNYALGDDYIGSATIDLSPTTVEPECDGKYIVTPKGTVTYRGRTDLLEFTSYYILGDNSTQNWGESVGTYQHDFDLYVNIRRKSDGKTFTASWPFSMKKYALDFDQSQILSLFCSDAKTGLIHLSLKGGKPPYTYKLYTLDGTEIESKTSDGAVEFLKGSLGQRYRIKATDACGLSWVYQDVLLQDPAVVSSTMVERKSYCLGDHVKMAARFFPNATYRWHLPDGSIREGREIEFVAGEQSAGTYNVDISLTTCTVTLYANITVRIVQITQASGGTIERGACTNEAVRFVPDPATATINGKQVDQNEIEYLWERTTNPNDEESWQPMYGQNRESLEYSAQDPGVYYFRRRATIDECNSFSNYFKLTASMGIRVVMTPDEKMVTIKNKDPFTLTAGTVVSGGSPRTYQWQRSFDEKNWENVGREETYTEKKPFEITVYYRRLISSGGCTYEGDTITVRFKKRRAAYINPHLRQRTTDN